MSSSFDRMEAERLRRLATCWRAARPKSEEIAAAWQHFRAARAPGASLRRWSPAATVLAVAVLSSGVLFAASGLRTLLTNETRPPEHPEPRSASEPEPEQQAARRRGALPPPSKQAEPAPTALGSTAPSTGGRASAAALVLPPEQRAPSAPEAGTWTRAAEALRLGDTARATRELRRLEQSSDSVTRDAARLSRAQLAVAEGRGVEVRGMLLDLTQSETPFVRRRAVELLGSLP
jgi:hypothetical protein